MEIADITFLYKYERCVCVCVCVILIDWSVIYYNMYKCSRFSPAIVLTATVSGSELSFIRNCPLYTTPEWPVYHRNIVTWSVYVCVCVCVCVSVCLSVGLTVNQPASHPVNQPARQLESQSQCLSAVLTFTQFFTNCQLFFCYHDLLKMTSDTLTKCIWSNLMWTSSGIVISSNWNNINNNNNNNAYKINGKYSCFTTLKSDSSVGNGVDPLYSTVL